MNFIEPKIGEVFSCNGIKVRCVECDPDSEICYCDLCRFDYNSVMCRTLICQEGNRDDEKDVYFEEVKDE
jgi:hypothetical protein